MATKTKVTNRKLDARPDTLDFRDKMYEASLVDVPMEVDLKEYQSWKVPVLDQGVQGACTGFGLATVANYLLRIRRPIPDSTPVSPRMFYEMAKRYDEWPGRNYEGSSARGAMKGWHKHGICAEKLWPYNPKKLDRQLTPQRIDDAITRPLGAYCRVNHKDLVAMHAALAEVGILYATATVHAGWDSPDSNGVIHPDPNIFGGHAFVIIAYDKRGFWIQNSWGTNWGNGGFALLTYDDWLENGTDIWVARLGVPILPLSAQAAATTRSAIARQAETYAFQELRPHIISIGNDGLLRPHDTYGTAEEDVATIFEKDFVDMTKDWKKKRILLYAHGGLVEESTAIQRVADYRSALLKAEVYPISFIWKSDYWTTLNNILKDAISKRRPEGFLDSAKDFMLDRLDDALEPIARLLTGKMQWNEMKENALGATIETKGGARIALKYLVALKKKYPSIEIHLVGHSAGSIFHAPIVQLLTADGKITTGPLKGKSGYGLPISSCTLWAPACTMALFHETYLPAIQSSKIKRFALFTLTDETEQDDHCARIYNKSLLYLVSHAFEDEPRIPLLQEGTPILGMEKYIRADNVLLKLFKAGQAEWILSPNDAAPGSKDQSTATSHGGFDDDYPTVQATLARITQSVTVKREFVIHRSEASMKRKRRELMIYSNGNR